MNSDLELNFFCVGPQRTASSWLHQNLEHHHQIGFPFQVKETFFFDRYYEKGMEWYLWHFRNSSKEQKLAEIAPTYFDDDKAPDRILSQFPNAKIIINVRDPIAKSHSLFRHHLSKGRLPNSFEASLKKMPRIIESGRYQKHCQRWESKFGDSVTYLVQEDVQESPNEVLDHVFKFLGIDNIKPSEKSDERINSASAPKSRALAKTMSFAATTLRSMRLHSVVEFGKRLGLKSVFSGSGKVDVLTPEMHQQLVGIFDSDIRWLEQRLNRDFSHWRKFQPRT